MTRHLIVVAMSQPLATSPGLTAQPDMFGSADTWQSIAMLLYQVCDHLTAILRTIGWTIFARSAQDRVRLHLILHASSHLNAFRDFFRSTVSDSDLLLYIVSSSLRLIYGDNS